MSSVKSAGPVRLARIRSTAFNPVTILRRSGLWRGVGDGLGVALLVAEARGEGEAVGVTVAVGVFVGVRVAVRVGGGVNRTGGSLGRTLEIVSSSPPRSLRIRTTFKPAFGSGVGPPDAAADA